MYGEKTSILLVGDGASIFFHDYVKALKKEMDVEVDVYSFRSDNGYYLEHPYDNVYWDDYDKSWLYKARKIHVFYEGIMERMHLSKYLRRRNKKYDIIHFHWVIGAWTLHLSEYHKYAKKVFATLWGGEFENMKLCWSHSLYMKKLKSFALMTDTFVSFDLQRREGANAEVSNIIFSKQKEAFFGSAIIEKIAMNSVSNAEAKNSFSIPDKAITVMTGYSGKSIHRHLEVIETICSSKEYDKYADRIYFLLPMTRGAFKSYIDSLEEKLHQYNAHYVIFKDRYLTEDEVMMIRKATDIAVQMTTFDGLSSSVKECLVAGNILISGSWFKQYHVLKEQGFKYIEVDDFEQFASSFWDVIRSPQKYADYALTNKNVGKSKYFWSECIKPWAKYYREAVNR